MGLRFIKTEALGNDLIIIDARTQVVGDPSEIAVQLCHRRYGIGGDGLLLITSDASTPMMRMFNPDGSEDFCGNGLCCTAAYLWEF